MAIKKGRQSCRIIIKYHIHLASFDRTYGWASASAVLDPQDKSHVQQGHEGGNDEEAKGDADRHEDCATLIKPSQATFFKYDLYSQR